VTHGERANIAPERSSRCDANDVEKRATAWRAMWTSDDES